MNQKELDEQFMADSAEKRAADSKPLTDKGALKADTDENLVEHKSTVKEVMVTEEYISMPGVICSSSRLPVAHLHLPRLLEALLALTLLPFGRADCRFGVNKQGARCNQPVHSHTAP